MTPLGTFHSRIQLLQFCNLVTVIPSVSSGLQRRVITEDCKDVGAPLTNVFLTVLGNCMSCGPSQGE